MLLSRHPKRPSSHGPGEGHLCWMLWTVLLVPRILSRVQCIYSRCIEASRLEDVCCMPAFLCSVPHCFASRTAAQSLISWRPAKFVLARLLTLSTVSSDTCEVVEVARGCCVCRPAWIAVVCVSTACGVKLMLKLPYAAAGPSAACCLFCLLTKRLTRSQSSHIAFI